MKYKWNTLSFLNPSIYISFGYIFELDGRASHETHRDEFIRGTSDDSTVQRAKFFLRDSHLEGGFVHRLESVNIHALRSGTLEETQRTKHRFIVPDTVVSLSLPPSPLSLSLSPAMNAKSGHDGVRTTPLTMTKRKSTQFHPPSACTHGRKADLLRALPPLPPAPSSQWYIKLATNLWRIISNEYIFFTGNSHQLRVTAYLHGIWKTNRKKEGIEGGACTERGMEKETVDG